MASYDPDTEVYTLPFSELRTFLLGLTAGIYKLNITEMVASDIGDSTTSGTLGYKIRSVASDVKIDLSETVLPAGITDMSKCFYSCTSLVTAPVIPNSVTNMTYCFQFCTSLTTAPSIPDSVTNIYYCFYHCEALTIAPLIPNSVINMQGCFAGTSLTTAPEIPDSVENMIICFSGCSLLTEPPVIPSSVTDIRQCFGGCTSLTIAPTIPNSVTDMSNCFNGCTSLTIAPTIPNSVTDMSDCFNGCTSLTIAPTIPDSVTVMNNCFYGCTALTDITWDMGDISGTYPAVSCFDSCSKLTNIWVPNLSKELETENFITTNKSTMHFPSSKDVKTVVKSLTNQIRFIDLDTYLQAQPNNTTSTPYELNVIEISDTDDFKVPLRNNSTKYVDLSETVLPNSITDMTSYFRYCSSLIVSPEIPDSVTDMSSCFQSCTSLVTAPVIPDSVTNIMGCFSNCTNLSEAPVIPNSVTNMESCFEYCRSLTTATTIPSSVTSMAYCFASCSSLTTVPAIPDSVTNMNYCFQFCTSLTAAPSIPNSVTKMSNCFEACNSLITAPKIPNSVTNMSSCFGYCSSLTTVPNIPDSVTNMNYCFEDCTALTDITWNIGNVSQFFRCFSDCTSLQEIKTPSKLKEAKTEKFLTTNRSNLGLNSSYDIPTLVTTDATTIPYAEVDEYLGYLEDNTTSTPYELTVVDIGFEDVMADVLVDHETKFVDLSNTVLPNKTDFTEEFINCVNLITPPAITTTAVNITNMFKGCSNLSSPPLIPNFVINMTGTFDGCSSLTEGAEIPNSVTNMSYCYSGCEDLTSVPNIPPYATDLSHCFENCDNLVTIESFEISYNNLQNVDMTDVFKLCTSLTNVYIPQPNISDGDVWKLVKVSLSDETYEIFSVTDGVEEKTGTISVTASKNTLVIDGVSDEIVVAGEDKISQTKIQQYFTYHKAFTSDPNTLTPDGHKFVLWAKDPSEVVSNVLGGGGGSSFVQNVTQEQYDALTPEEKNNGQIRHITDAPEVPVPFAVVNDDITTSANVWTAQKTNSEINTAKTQIMNRTSLDWSRAEETVATDLNENTFTATEDGVLFWDLTGGNNQFAYVQINNIFITKSIPTGSSYISSTNGSVMVSQGDIVKWKEGIVISSNVSLHKIIFVPYKAN